MSAQVIQTHSKPLCALCGTEGEIVHSQLHDTLFHAPGEWNLRLCRDPKCGLMWLDPMPNSDEIGKLYQQYYTHVSANPDTNDSFIGKMLTVFSKPLYGIWMRTTGLRSARKQLNYLYLLKQQPGLLLDIGCGDGSRLARFRKRGWKVEGYETDSKAAAHAAAKYQLQIHTGDLLELALTGNHYDAIILNHVLEHLSDPATTLKECLRLVKPGGLVIATTPNSKSYGHRYFKGFWRGLEPPRHLYIYSPQSLQILSNKYSLGDVEVWTTAARAESIASGSYTILANAGRLGRREFSPALRASLFQAKAQIRYLLDNNTGEECVMRITKQAQ